jgi:hypothetical protein
MVKFMKGALLVGVASLALGSVATAQESNGLTPAEFKCMTGLSKAGAKFTGAKAKCAAKCQTNASKATEAISDCYSPYAGATADCIIHNNLKPGKSAEELYVAAIRKACDPTVKVGSKTECPECFGTNGDCNTFATDRMNTNEGQVDDFGPGVFCKGQGKAPTPPTKEELACEQNTAKVLVKLVGSINKCYDKCNGNLFKGVITGTPCDPPTPSDPATSACLDAVRGKAVAGIDAKCSVAGVVPNCDETITGPKDYADGATWVSLVDAVIEGNQSATYCGSPSGAFIN